MGNMTGARSSIGRSTGKYLFQGTVITPTRPDAAAVSFGFMSAGGGLSGTWPGYTGSPAGTGFGIGPLGHFIFTDVVYRFYFQSELRWSLPGGDRLTFAIDLDEKLYWISIKNGIGGDSCWMYDPLVANDPPIPDPDMLVGTSYASMITDSDEIFPFVFFQYGDYSGSVNFAPTEDLCPAPGFLAWDTADPATAALSATDPVETLAGVVLSGAPASTARTRVTWM